jgi:hypothetical protein
VNEINAKWPRLSISSLMCAMLIISPIVGVIDVVKAYQHHDLKDAIVVVCIYFVGTPLFALWWLRRHPITGNGKSWPRSQ